MGQSVAQVLGTNGLHIITSLGGRSEGTRTRAEPCTAQESLGIEPFMARGSYERLKELAVRSLDGDDLSTARYAIEVIYKELITSAKNLT